MKVVAGEPFVVSKEGSYNRTMIEHAFAEKGLSLKIVLEVDVHYGSRDAIKTAVASGLGLASTHRSQILGDIKLGRLAALNVPELKLERTIHIAVHKSRQTSTLIQAFINFLEDYKRQNPQQD